MEEEGFSKREAEAICKSTKILAHYLHFFGEIKNVFYVVAPNPVPGQTPWTQHGPRVTENKDCKYNIFIHLRKARPEWRKDNGEKVVLTDQRSVLGNMLELCPDIVVVDRKESQDETVYRIQSIKHELNFIRSDFFKR